MIKEYKLRSPGFYKKLSDLAEKLLILMVTFLGAQIAFWSTFFLINGGSFVGNIQIVIWTSVVCNCLGFFCLIYTDFWAFAKFELLMEKE